MKTKLGIISCFLILAFSACETVSLEPFSKRERVSVHIVNLYSQVNKVDFVLQTGDMSNTLADDLSFGESWPEGGYNSILTTQDPNDSVGTVYIQVIEDGTTNELVAPELLGLLPGQKITILLIEDQGQPKIVKTVDVFEPDSDTLTNIRFMNLNSQIISASLVDPASSFSINNLNFLNYSSFQQIPVQEHTFRIVHDVTKDTIATMAPATIQSGFAYTYYLARQNGSSTVVIEALQ